MQGKSPASDVAGDAEFRALITSGKVSNVAIIREAGGKT
jgi:hypothetical protein